MRLILKTLLFFILGYVGAGIATIPFSIFFPALSALVFPLTWAAFTLYPAYEHFFIRQKRFTDTDENDRIKAYIRFIRIRKFINYIRFIASFFASIFFIIILSIIGYSLNLQDNPEFEAGKLMVGVFIVSWLAFYQIIQFGLHKNLALSGKDETLISIDEYNKIEYEIIKLNRLRRISILGLVLLSAIIVNALSLFNEAGLGLLGLIIFLIAMQVINFQLKKKFKQKIFPHISEINGLSFADYNNKLVLDNKHPIITENLEKMHTDSYLEYKNKNGKPRFRLWERMDGIRTFLVICVKLDEAVEDSVYLSTDNLTRKTGKPEIPNSTHQFGSIFRLFGNDNVLAYKFMTPIVQENFLKLIANANAFDFHCSAQNDEMCIVMKCGGNLFEIGSLFRKITLNSINQIIAEVRLAKQLPDLFEL